MELKQVELVRRKVVADTSNNLIRFRSWLSCIDGNGPAVDLLRGESGEALVADLTETIMLHLGVANEITRMKDGGAKVTSQARKAARGSMG